MTDLTETFWREFSADLDGPAAGLATKYGLKPLDRVANLEVAVRRSLDGRAAAEFVERLGLVSGWLTLLHPTGSRVAIIGDSKVEPDATIGAGEGLDELGRTYRIGPGGDGTLAVWVYSGQLDEGALGNLGFERLPSIRGLLRERRGFPSVRLAIRSVEYDVYWAATADDGSLQRLALFAGFERHASEE